jgi:ElaB/YqjD/DUF883 family membrane-anchored ribosome-binding protein
MVGPANRGFGTLEPEQGTKPGTRPESSGMGNVVETVKDKAQDLASAAASKAGEAWDTAKHGVEQAYTKVADTAENALKMATDCMSRYPVATLLAGFGLGFLVAQAFSFRRRD